jgi:hypothetical protein
LEAVRQHGEGHLINERNTVADMVDYFRAQDPTNQATIEAPRTVQQALDQLTETGDAKGIANLQERIRFAGIPEGADLTAYHILGEANVETTAEGVFRGVIKLRENSRPEDAFEEINHVFVRKALAEGRVDLDSLRGWLTQTSEATGQTYATETETDIIENIAKVGMDYAAGRIEETQLPASFVDYIKRMLQVFKEAMARAIKLKDAFAAGKIDANFESFLADSVGLNQQARVDTSRKRTSGELTQGTFNYSIGGGSLGNAGRVDEKGIHPFAKPRPSTYTNPNESEFDPSAILETLLRGKAGADSTKRRKHGRTLASFSEIVDWAESQGRTIDPSIFAERKELGSGGEHLVFQAEGGRVYKLTKPGLFGIQADDAGAYLQRWALANRLFNDDARIEGIVKLPGESDYRTVVSHRHIDGRDSTQAEIKDYLQSHGFVQVESQWIHPTLGIAALDAETAGNSITMADGTVAPVDLNLQPASPQYLDQARKQTGLGGQTNFSIGSRARANEEVPSFLASNATLTGPTNYSIGAFHGTPHKVDRFSLDKIGTGEGAQAYGWGLYFAQEKEVALKYAPRDEKADAKMMAEYKRAETLQDYDSMEFWENAMLYKTRDELVDYHSEQLGKKFAPILKKWDAIQASGKGALYTVELDVNEEDLLDWDKPLSEQSEKVQAALDDWLYEKRNHDAFSRGDLNTFQLLGELAWKPGEDISQSDRKLSELLLSLGIPGIRYLDGGSRSKGEGSHNYVIFDETLIKITEENGKRIAAADALAAPSPGATNYSIGESDDQRFADLVEGIASGKGDRTKAIPAGGTPNALILGGADPLPLTMRVSVVEKATVGKHSLPLDAVKSLPPLLRDPIFVFQSTQISDALTVILDQKHNGSSIMAAVHLNQQEQQHEINRIASIYDKQSLNVILGWIRSGLLRYINTEKAKRWSRSFGLQLPKEATTALGKKVKTEADLVKANYSIASQSEIDRVNRALGGMNRGPDERLKVYERAKAKFSQVLQSNKESLDVIKTATPIDTAPALEQVESERAARLADLTAEETAEIAKALQDNADTFMPRIEAAATLPERKRVERDAKDRAKILEKGIRDKYAERKTAIETEAKTQRQQTEQSAASRDSASRARMSERVRRTQLLQAIGELDAILSVLPPEVRGRVGGYTKLASIAPHDVFKDGVKVSEHGKLQASHADIIGMHIVTGVWSFDAKSLFLKIVEGLKAHGY